MSSLDIRSATEEDLPGILETLRLALGETPLLRRTPELWHWKHRDNPFGSSIVLVALSDQGAIAGVRAFTRWELVSTTDGVVRCVRPVDTATHPAFTRQGIFRTLTLSAIEVARADGVQLIFNTPNEKSSPGYLSMGWESVGHIGAQVRPRLGVTVNPNSEERPIIDKWAPKALAPSDLPKSDSIESARLSTPRTPEYLKWRYQGHPYASYGWVPGSKGGGLVVRASVRGDRAELVACDLLGTPDASAVRNASRASRARYLAGWFSPGTDRRRASVSGGLLPLPGVKTLRLVANPLADLTVDAFDPNAWDLSTSDLELL